MKTQATKLILVTVLFCFPQAMAKDVEEIKETIEQTEVVEEGKESKFDFSARMDVGLSRGVAVSEGFRLPGLRVTAAGTLTDFLKYRLSIGQTKEFTTIVLPQMIPVEAYVTVIPNEEHTYVPVNWKIGMMTPSLNPWWTPDLAEVTLPDYSISHQSLLLNRDIGTEVIFMPMDRQLEVVLGIFNGNGIIGNNSNGSLSATSMIRYTTKVGLGLGVSGILLRQGNRGANNYRSQNIGNVFLSWDNALFTLGAEGFIGYYEDDIRRLNPYGGAGLLNIKLNSYLNVFGRYENLVKSIPVGKNLRRLQAGPVWVEGDFLKVFMYYQWLDESGRAGESSAELRVRVTI